MTSKKALKKENEKLREELHKQDTLTVQVRLCYAGEPLCGETFIIEVQKHVTIDIPLKITSGISSIEFVVD